jgi:transposase
MKQAKLHLSESDRFALNAFRGKGVHAAREVNRAHVLMALDRGVGDPTICQVLGLGRTALWRTRAAYRQGGWEYALRDEARPGQPRKYQTAQEAEVVALACSAPPSGRKRWTVRLLTAAARERPGLAHVNRETVRQMLKKPLQARAQADVVHRPDHSRVSR